MSDSTGIQPRERLLEYREEFGLLQAGDLLRVEAGYTWDQETGEYVDEPVTDHVYIVKGNSLLLVNGLTLGGCEAAGHVWLVSHQTPSPEPSDKAKCILESIERQQEVNNW